MLLKSLAVFCGSKSGTNPLYELHATELGEILAENKVNLVYGGGNKGLMAAVANGALLKGGAVYGVIPRILSDREHKHDGLTELVLTNDMHERKLKIYQQCDAAIALPGGYGTLDELFEMITWHTLELHNKKVFILNSGGFYTHLIAHIVMMQKENFLYRNFQEQVTVLNEPKEIIPFLNK